MLPAASAAQDRAPLSGNVFDRKLGTPVAGVTVTLVFPAPADGGEPRREIQETGADGGFGFEAVPVGKYELRLAKEGYAEAKLEGVEVRADQPNETSVNLARLEDEALAPQPAALPPELAGVEQMEITSTAIDRDASREQADEQIDTMSAEQMSDFSVPDVAAGLRFVPGVSVVDGQFAVIRGLEDRYNSTLYNSAPIPSPDPDSQSVQLDLFPADVVSNLVIAKTFAPELPSNSSGGSVNIITNESSGDETEIKLSLGTGINENAADRFFEFEGGSPIGKERDSNQVIESDFGTSFHGGTQVLDRDVHYKGVFAFETDFDSKDGDQEAREPVRPGGLGAGELGLSGGRFELAESEWTQQQTGYLGMGFGLDEDSNHTLDASVFYTQKLEESVLARENGYVPGFDYAGAAQRYANGDEFQSSSLNSTATETSWLRKFRTTNSNPASTGALLTTNFNESRSFDRDRDLIVSQLNGDHWLGVVEGLHLTWAANHARTNQDESALSARYFFEPDDIEQAPTRFPVRAEELGPGRFGVNNGLFSSDIDVSEVQNFARADLDWEFEVSSAMFVELRSGIHYEKAERDVASDFLELPFITGTGTQFAILRDTPEELGKAIFDQLSDGGYRASSNDSEREIHAWNLGAKATLWEQLDLLAGIRFENIRLESNNDPFTGSPAPDGTPDIFPDVHLFFDRMDNPARGFEVVGTPPAGRSFNDQLLGIPVAADPVTGFVDLLTREEIQQAVNGEIDERRRLPSFAFTYRPAFTALDGLTLRGAFSRTVARPSFREMGYYVSVEPGTDDLIIGNPQLRLSDVKSWDLRAEYTFNDTDLFATSVFTKEIEKPLESIIIRDPTNFESSGLALYRTFYNNPSDADLRGIEFEARKNLGFLGPDLADYFTLGGNYTYIDAEVDRAEIEQERASEFFRTSGPARYTHLERTRRLFGQPEWIANLNLTFDQPDWGTNVTLAYFAISDVLDAAGGAFDNGSIYSSMTTDRYIDSYHTLDLVVTQSWGAFKVKLSLKNLTDSTRRIIYDRDQTASTIPERSYKVGRDLSLSIGYAF
jgi:TonB-dependent receptor